MNKYYVRYRFDTQEIVEYQIVMAESEESAIRKTSELVFEEDDEFGSYFSRDSLLDITVRRW